LIETLNAMLTPHFTEKEFFTNVKHDIKRAYWGTFKEPYWGKHDPSRLYSDGVFVALTDKGRIRLTVMHSENVAEMIDCGTPDKINWEKFPKMLLRQRKSDEQSFSA